MGLPEWVGFPLRQRGGVIVRCQRLFDHLLYAGLRGWGFAVWVQGSRAANGGAVLGGGRSQGQKWHRKKLGELFSGSVLEAREQFGELFSGFGLWLRPQVGRRSQ